MLDAAYEAMAECGVAEKLDEEVMFVREGTLLQIVMVKNPATNCYIQKIACMSMKWVVIQT
jgi:hypothetical protein